MTTSTNNSAEIKFFVLCFAGNVLTVISTHETKEQANKEYKMKLSLTEARFYAGVGYVKLYKK